MDQPKMSRKQARLLWNNLSPKQKAEFNKLMYELQNNKLMLSNVLVDDNEQIQKVILENKDKPSIPYEPFIKNFDLKS